MLSKTRGIVISHIKYKETSIIVKIYTEEFGLQTYIVNGVRSGKSSKSTIALYQSLNLLDLVVYHKEGNAINHIKEIKVAFVFKQIPYDHIKCAIAIFLTEILQKTIKEHYENKLLFEFLYDSFQKLDQNQTDIENFHLIFLLQYSSFLGFIPLNSKTFFDEISGEHQIEELNYIDDLLQSKDYITSQKVSNQTRRKILTKIVYLFQIHVESFGELKSLDVLREIIG
jgi:DNA repair protein RecO (recombination protein O)